MSQEARKLPKLMWTAKGKIVPANNSVSTDDPKDDIQIFETPCSFQMSGEETKPYGINVDNKGAVQMMRELLKDLKKAKIDLGTLHLQWEKLQKWTGQEGENELREKILLLLVASFGISFDKSILLKILSQPLCEGIRFYPCKKGDNPAFFSLVLVGVDKDGYDLHFEDISLNDLEPKGAGAAVTSKSATSEYGHPPTQIRFAKSDKFCLLRLAEQGL